MTIVTPNNSTGFAPGQANTVTITNTSPTTAGKYQFTINGGNPKDHRVDEGGHATEVVDGRQCKVKNIGQVNLDVTFTPA